MMRTCRTIAGLIALSLPLSVPAQTTGPAYPSKSIRLVIPFAAGSTTDFLARIVATKLGERLGQQVLVDPKPGANGIVANDFVAKAAPDGYTLIIASNGTHGINSSLFSRLPYDPVKDFEAISNIGQVTYVLVVRNGHPAKNFTEFIAAARANPGTVTYGSTASVAELAGVLLGVTTGVQFNRVSYKSPSQALTDMIGERLDSLMEPGATLIGQIRNGTIRPFAVSSKTRMTQLPNVPTVAESGYPDYEVIAWQPMLAPAGTPRTIIDRLSTEVQAILRLPDVGEQYRARGIEPFPTTPAQTAEMIRNEIAKWARLFKEANLPKAN